MGIPVLIIGKSGSGKSTSLRNCQNFGVVNVLGKPLPFKNQPKTWVTDDYGKIITMLLKNRADKKVNSIVIDDAGYLITNQFMRGHSSQGAGNAIFSFYNSIADKFWALIDSVKELPADKIVYFFMHTDTDEGGNVKPKTIGKLLDEKVCVEGMFTIVLHSRYEDGKYIFATRTDGTDVAKSPMGMFCDENGADVDEIDNDLKLVDDTIREYYNLNKKEEESKNAEA